MVGFEVLLVTIILLCVDRTRRHPAARRDLTANSARIFDIHGKLMGSVTPQTSL
jgi:hypothetical protein